METTMIRVLFIDQNGYKKVHEFKFRPMFNQLIPVGFDEVHGKVTHKVTKICLEPERIMPELVGQDIDIVASVQLWSM